MLLFSFQEDLLLILTAVSVGTELVQAQLCLYKGLYIRN